MFLSELHFIDESAAFAYVESKVWPKGPICAHCGCADRLTRVKANPAKRIRAGLWRCGHCKGQFTVKAGTSLHRARVPMHKILQAIYLLMGQNNDVTPAQLQRVLEITYKSARFLTSRIRATMAKGGLLVFDDDTCNEADATWLQPLFTRSDIANVVATERLVLSSFRSNGWL